MNQTELDSIVLDLASDDSVAFSEIAAAIRQREAVGAIAARRYAHETVSRLFGEARVAINWLESPDGPEVLLDDERARRALQDDLMWLELPHWRPHARVVATSEGAESRYRSER